MSYGVKLKVWGDYALFTRPEMKSERVSYDVITPSAARGVLEAVYWKPEIKWIIKKIHVLKPIRFTNIRRNEVSQRTKKPSTSLINKGGTDDSLALYIEDSRQQRASMILRDVSYVIEAYCQLNDPADSNIGKHLDMFKRRAAKGKCFSQPYFGCREFSANFRRLGEDEAIASSENNGEKDLGFMLHDLDYQNNYQPRFFRAVMHNGIIEVPDLFAEEVKT
ncbi:type I-C CRISPR-associated protein Cas5c [Sedimentisphaera salicampi]|uniref:pre-crRNA processing endonuclease n=1 Tax=Sedimentisphaera salicampi TaxID=1941349 RepID=A0A1W6LLI3_9BACT|nr:type I-C CRISPR-associated protein Cas5c [Sedimentisphaera salicampi]ARN56658.1 CRISPR-associated protein Cas5 [Sedimentisphaera salicampi]